MDKNTQILLDTLDYSIKQLIEQKNQLLAKIPLAEKIKKDCWVIEKSTNTYFQFVKLNGVNSLDLVRNGKITCEGRLLFEERYRIAEKWEVEQHLEFLRVKKAFQEEQAKPQLPEFYMITVKGEHGTKYRHESFDLAVTEAKRLSKKTNHRAHIMGVVAIVEPIEVLQPIIEYQLIK